MKQEEKAKRYDELLLKLQKAKVDDDVCDEMYYRVIDDIVPELKESEDKIYKRAIRQMYSLLPNKPTHIGDVRVENIFAWLEKQGEQKFAEWSKEDEAITLQIEQIIKCAHFLNIVPEKLNKINKWLKSLKQRIKE